MAQQDLPDQPLLTWTNRALYARSVHRLLFKRLLGMTLVMCLLTACSFYLMERARFTAALRDGVLHHADRFQTLAVQDLSKPGLGDHRRLQDILDDALSSDHAALGTAALTLIRDQQGRVVAKRWDPAFRSSSALNDYLATSCYSIPAEPGGPRYELVAIASRPFLHILVPLVDATGGAAAYSEGLFAVSEAVIHDANLRMGLTLALTVSLVLGTSGMLYPVLLRLLRQTYAASQDLLEANLETLNVLGCASAKRDSDVDAHSYRVTIYAVCLGERMGLDRQTMRALIKGAFLHDVGKIGVRDALLRKPGRLTPEEVEEMRQHVQHGRDIASRAHWLSDALAVISGHHERFDGTGYDQGLKGQEIPLVARIFAVVDVFDALVSPRPYKQAMQFEVVVEMLEKESGKHFDPAVLYAFAPIARELYAACAARPTDELDAWLRTNCARYFGCDIGEWLASLDARLRR